MQNDIKSDLPTGLERSSRHTRSAPFIIFLLIWILLIGSGIAGTIWYSERVKAELSAQLQQQTAAQITAMQKQYEAQLTAAQESFNSQILELDGKVQALNELLQFTKDNADTDTDNSNQLYTQISAIQKKLNELQKALDVLK